VFPGDISLLGARLPHQKSFAVVGGISVVSVATRVMLGNTQLKMLGMSTGSKCSLL